MFVKEEKSDDLIRIHNIDELIDPTVLRVRGRRQAGEEEQELSEFNKEELTFPSGEALPLCWKVENYSLR